MNELDYSFVWSRTEYKECRSFYAFFIDLSTYLISDSFKRNVFHCRTFYKL